MSDIKKSSLDINLSDKKVILPLTAPIINSLVETNYTNKSFILFKYIIGIVSIILLGSLYEYIAHRFIMHNISNFVGKAHIEHHKETNDDMSLQYTSSFLDKIDKERNLIIRYEMNIQFFIFLLVFGLLIWRFLIGTNYYVPIIVAFLITCYVGLIWNSIHPQMHGREPYNGESGFPGIIPRKFLGFFEKHHMKHHKSKGTKNFNITLPLVDFFINVINKNK